MLLKYNVPIHTESHVMLLKYNVPIHTESCVGIFEQHCLDGIWPQELLKKLNQVHYKIADAEKMRRFEMRFDAVELPTFDSMHSAVMVAPGYHQVVVVLGTDAENHGTHAVAALTCAPARPRDVIMCTNSWGGRKPFMECTRANFRTAFWIDVTITRAFTCVDGETSEEPWPAQSLNYPGREHISGEVVRGGSAAWWTVSPMALIACAKGQAVS